MSTQDDTTETDEVQTPDDGELAASIETDRLETAFDALRAVHGEAVTEFDADGLTAYNVDPGSVLMAEVRVPPDAFETYTGSQLRVGMRLERFADMATAGDMAHVEWDTNDWKFRAESGPVDASLSVIAPDEVRTERPSEQVWDNATVAWEMPYADLKAAIGATSKLGGSVAKVIATDEFLGLRKEADDDDVEVAFADADVDRHTDDVEVLQSEDYLKEIRKATPKDVTLTCHTATEWPLVIEYEHNGVEVTFVQAPRIPK